MSSDVRDYRYTYRKRHEYKFSIADFSSILLMLNNLLKNSKISVSQKCISMESFHAQIHSSVDSHIVTVSLNKNDIYSSRINKNFTCLEGVPIEMVVNLLFQWFFKVISSIFWKYCIQPCHLRED